MNHDHPTRVRDCAMCDLRFRVRVEVTTTITLPILTSDLIRTAADLWAGSEMMPSDWQGNEYLRAQVELIADAEDVPGIEHDERKRELIAAAIIKEAQE